MNKAENLSTLAPISTTVVLPLQPPSENPYLTIEMRAYEEWLRQTRQIFNIHLIAITASLCIGVVGGIVQCRGRQ
jgi:hypothetical protein